MRLRIKVYVASRRRQHPLEQVLQHLMIAQHEQESAVGCQPLRPLEPRAQADINTYSLLGPSRHDDSLSGFLACLSAFLLPLSSPT